MIHGVDPSQVIIAGPTPYGTEFGVYEFLERYVGVRWLMPGPDGEDVPARVQELTHGHGATVGFEASGNKGA